MHREYSRWGLVFVLVVGLLVRVGFVAYRWDNIGSQGQLKDTDSYGRLALNLVKFGTFGFPIESSADSQSSKPGYAEPTTSATAKSRNSKLVRKKVTDAESVARMEDSTEELTRTWTPPPMRPTAYRPPVYPAMLTVAALPDIANNVPLNKVSLNAYVIVGMHILFGLVTIGMLHYIAWRMDLRWGWIPALAVAADPILLHWSGEIMTETLVTMLATWAWALYLILVRPMREETGLKLWGMHLSLRVSLMLGLVLGLAVLTRPTMLPWAAIMIASLSLRRSDAGSRVTMITAALIVMSVMNIAWMVRNKQQFGEPIWTTTHGGYTLLLANNPPLYEHFKTAGPDRNWDADKFHKLWAMRRSGDPTQSEFWNAEVPVEAIAEPDIDELKDDRLAEEAAKATIERDPKTFALSCLYRAGWLWSVTPNVGQEQNRERWIIAGWYASWFAMALLGLWWVHSVIASRVWLMPLLLLLTLTAIHTIYWSNMRMRAPMMPVVYLVACWPLMSKRSVTRL